MSPQEIRPLRFSHERLAQYRTSIRLLTVLGSFNGRIHCELSHTTLEKAPRYYAVSYMWGDDAVMREIFIDGNSMYVRDNIWQFLRKVRNAKINRRTPLWIDAICIDQTQNEERNHQVRLMDKIYSQAETVLIWLGQCAEPRNCLSDLNNWSPPRSACKGRCRDLLHPMLNVLHDPYWSRMWIVQEIYLAQEILVLHGRQSAQWDNLWEHLHAIRDHMRECPKTWALINRSAEGDPWKHIYTTEADKYYEHTSKDHGWDLAQVGDPRLNDAQDMEKLIETYKHHKCSDKRDRVIALLSLVDGGSHFQLDYAKSAVQLAIEAWAHFGGGKTLLTVLADALEVTTQDIQSQLQHENLAITLQPWNSWGGVSNVIVGYLTLFCIDCRSSVFRLEQNFSPNYHFLQLRPAGFSRAQIDAECVTGIFDSTNAPLVSSETESVGKLTHFDTEEESRKRLTAHMRTYHSPFINRCPRLRRTSSSLIPEIAWRNLKIGRLTRTSQTLIWTEQMNVVLAQSRGLPKFLTHPLYISQLGDLRPTEISLLDWELQH